MRLRNLNGWQRLWLVVSAIWILAITLFVMSAFPKPDASRNDAARALTVRSRRWLQAGPSKIHETEFCEPFEYPLDASDSEIQEGLKDRAPRQSRFVERLGETLPKDLRDGAPPAELEEYLRSLFHDNCQRFWNDMARSRRFVLQDAGIAIDPARVDVGFLMSGTPNRVVDEIRREYETEYGAIRSREYRQVILLFFLVALLPCGVLYGLGWSAGWIRDGFRNAP